MPKLLNALADYWHELSTDGRREELFSVKTLRKKCHRYTK